MNLIIKKVCFFILVLFIASCQAPPRYDCYYWFTISGTVKDGGNLPIEGVEIRRSTYLDDSAPDSTDVNGSYSIDYRTYYEHDEIVFTFSKTGFQTQNSVPVTKEEILSSCNKKVQFVRDIILVP